MSKPAPPIPPPLLAGPPIPLPDLFQGDWAGATVQYDLDRLLEWQYVDADLIKDLAAEEKLMRAERAALDPADDTAISAFNRRQRALNHRIAARRASYYVGVLNGPVRPAPDDRAAWEAVSWWVLRWITKEGLDAALEQVKTPFSEPASPPSGATAA